VTNRAIALVILNLALAGFVHLAPPAGSPHDSDRAAYDFVGAHPFAPNCGWSIYCYRILVPVALQPLSPFGERRYRWMQLAGTASAGIATSAMVFTTIGTLRAAAIAAIVAQTCYGFAFTAYDPYSPDPIVFLFAALIAWCWLADRWRTAWVLGTVGVFAKETVAFVAAACLLASLVHPRHDRSRWIGASVAVITTVVAFHAAMDAWLGWTIANNPAAQFARGSWLVVWWTNNPFWDRKLYLLFATFGVAWFFAARGFALADDRLRALALGAIVPVLALCYVQTPERALSNGFFVVAPLAALSLAAASSGWAIATAVVNGALTVKVGTSTPLLPNGRYLAIAALLCSAGTLWSTRNGQKRSWAPAPNSNVDNER
jgi:hypothetical protein